MMTRLLDWFERKAPWIRTKGDRSYLAEMAAKKKAAEEGAIRTQAQTETFVEAMWRDRAPTHPRLPAKSQ